MNWRYFRGFLIIMSIVIISCEKEESPSEQEPTDLVIEVNNLDDGSGIVEISATANNTIEYQLTPGDNSSSPISNTTGEFNYTYSASGVYLLEVRAYGVSGRFIKTEVQVTVFVENGTDPDDGYTTPPTYDGMTLIWTDEFNGNTLDASSWTHELGPACCNNELQYHREQNTSVADGYLVIEAREENIEGRNYTSSRMVTKNKVDFKYGRVDIRAKLPKGKGLWPALWMLGSNIDQVGWPSCGEIDIMEMVGGSTSDNTTHGTIHWDNDGQHASYGDGYMLTSGIFNDEFHVFTIIWTNASIIWYVDDVEFVVADITPAGLNELHQDNFFIFNVAVGGNWPGSPDGTTVFPQQMIVDYVRVFQDN